MPLNCHPATSIIYSAMQRSIKTIISFFFFYFTVILAFSLRDTSQMTF